MTLTINEVGRLFGPWSPKGPLWSGAATAGLLLLLIYVIIWIRS